MLTYEMLKSLIEGINNIVGPRFYILSKRESKSNNENNSKDLIFMDNISLDEGMYDIYINDPLSLNDRETGVVKLLLEDKLKSYNSVELGVKEKNILRLFNEDIDEIERGNILSRLGISSDDIILAFTIKLHEVDDYLEVISIVENIISYNLIFSLRVKDDMVVVCSGSNGDPNLAEMVAGTIETELYRRVKIGVSQLRESMDIKKAYEESLQALEIGTKYQLSGNVFELSNLLIYRIIDHISKKDLVESYGEMIKEYMSKLTRDDIKTASVFLDSNLNISEASRQLYIHRNTLIYRLDKIQKDTGFDLRNFRHSLEFKLLLVIYKYLNH